MEASSEGIGTPPQRSIAFVYFDLDDTLLDHRHAEQQALAEVCQEHQAVFAHLSVEAVQEAYHQHNQVLWRRYRQGEIDQQTLRRLRFEQLLEALAIDELDAGFLNTLYMDCYARHWTLAEGAGEAFHTIADRLPVGILTNGFSEVQHAKLAQFPQVRDRLHTLVISDEVGHLKPHPAIFAHATEQAGVPAEAILYVGDSYSSDIEGGLKAGWQVAWYTRTEASAAREVFRFQQWERLIDRVLVATNEQANTKKASCG